MIAMGGFSLPQKTVREIIVGSVDVVIQAQRLRDGSRRITEITEVIGMEGEGDHHPGPGEIPHVGRGLRREDHRANMYRRELGRPKFWDRARYFGEDQRLAAALDAMETQEE